MSHINHISLSCVALIGVIYVSYQGLMCLISVTYQCHISHIITRYVSYQCHICTCIISVSYMFSPVCCHLFVVGVLCTSMTRIAMLTGVLYSWCQTK